MKFADGTVHASADLIRIEERVTCFGAIANERKTVASTRTGSFVKKKLAEET